MAADLSSRLRQAFAASLLFGTGLFHFSFIIFFFKLTRVAVVPSILPVHCPLWVPVYPIAYSLCATAARLLRA